MLKEMEPLKPVEAEGVKVTKQWLQMGAELEGSWSNRKAVAVKVRGARVHDDRSVHIAHGDPGELVTRPHDNLDSLLEDIRALWPESVNDSCGFHLHASFTPMQASILATKDFYRFFKEEWARWGTGMKLDRAHEFWTRLSGRNKFCKDLYDPEAQLKPMHGGAPGEKRYTMLNWYAWEKHKTVECRLLPMFTNVELGLSAVRCLSEIYNTYLSQNGFQTITMEPATQVVGNMVEEVYTLKQPELTPRVYEAEGSFQGIPQGEDVFYAVKGAENQVLPFTREIAETTP